MTTERMTGARFGRRHTLMFGAIVPFMVSIAEIFQTGLPLAEMPPGKVEALANFILALILTADSAMAWLVGHSDRDRIQKFAARLTRRFQIYKTYILILIGRAVE